jgi:hypothetical protein
MIVQHRAQRHEAGASLRPHDHRARDLDLLNNGVFISVAGRLKSPLAVD